ncbi:MAG: hypothetical protein GF400_09210 [Candidatus Eisenbacteria bacterium]|nr:hypothetical protein [Candidatus Eisenbacteria bacterium]
MLYSAGMRPYRFVPPALALAVAGVLACLSPGCAHAVGSVSTVAARPLGMGGAFVAIEDEAAAAAWNPAAFLPRQCRRRGGFRFHVNVLGAPAIARETGLLGGDETDEFDRLSGLERLGIAVGGALKSIGYRRGGFACGVLLLEEHLWPAGLEESRGLADASDLLDGYYSTLCVTFRLGSSVSIGAAETLFARFDESGERRFGVGRSYGALLRPNDEVSVGLVYVDVPKAYDHFRRQLEGLAPRTMNAGLAWRPRKSLVLTFDLRDMAEKHDDTALKPRFGFEWNLWGKGAVRAGHYREERAGADVLSVGVGAIPMESCGVGAVEGRADAYVLNYAALLSEAVGPRHLLSVMLHF